MSEIVTEKVQVNTTGSAGSATGSANSKALHGFLLDVFLDYHADAPATTDVTLEYDDNNDDILVVSNNKTDGRYAPVKNNCDVAGAAISGVYANYPLNGPLTVSLAQCDELTPALTAWIRYLKP